MKLIAAKSNTRIDISIYEDVNGVAHIVRSRPNPLSWTLSKDATKSAAVDFAENNRIPLVSA
jgi:hypothetical protein